MVENRRETNESKGMNGQITRKKVQIKVFYMVEIRVI